MTLKEIRKEKGITLVHVARLLNVSPQTVRNKEKGISQFTASELKNLLRLYGVSIDDVEL